MADEIFSEPEESRDDWVDVRMTDPQEEEWDLDMVVIDGQVEYVDLRIRPALLTAFLDCLIADVGSKRAEEILTAVAVRNGLDLDTGPSDP